MKNKISAIIIDPNKDQHNYTGKERDERNKLSLSVVFSLTTTKKIYITNTEVQNVLACSN